MGLPRTGFFDVDDTHSLRDCSMREQSFPIRRTGGYTDVKSKERDQAWKGRWWEWTQLHDRGSG